MTSPFLTTSLQPVQPENPGVKTGDEAHTALWLAAASVSLLAHEEGGVPNIILRCGALNADTLGQLIYFFEYACGLSGYLLDVNPFDQPGVEAYKKNMFALLGKPGYEDMGQALREKLGR